MKDNNECPQLDYLASRQDLEYGDCIPCRETRMIQKWLHLMVWVSSSRALGSIEYSFIAITLIRSGSIC